MDSVFEGIEICIVLSSHAVFDFDEFGERIKQICPYVYPHLNIIEMWKLYYLSWMDICLIFIILILMALHRGSSWIMPIPTKIMAYMLEPEI